MFSIIFTESFNIQQQLRMISKFPKYGRVYSTAAAGMYHPQRRMKQIKKTTKIETTAETTGFHGWKK